ncbi:phage tail fiber protein [Pseudomonas typographi]|uniref:phage tail fiber protein n=1 Tax=Pseudomonas typographi TaxID=2715964 RepID=UPI00168263E1|nr:hypothetical protein [Pseudomonas typographi]MBD1554768.1 hypothetical protein [Pseudomonas typographi]
MSMSSQVITDSLTYYLTTGAPMTRPVDWQVSLHTADPGTGSSNEVTDSGYSRQDATFALDGTSQNVANQADLVFGTAASGFTVTHVVVWDKTNSIALVIQRLSTSKAVAAGAQALTAAGELKIGGSL